MAFRFCDSFDHYLTADITTKWTSQNSVNIVSTGRHGSGLTGNVKKTLDFQPTWIVGWAHKAPSGVSAVALYTLYALNTSGALQTVVTVGWNVDNSLSVSTPGGGLIGTTPAYDWAGGFHYIELYTTLSGTATITATCTLRVNTETVVTGSAITNFGAATVAVNAAKANVHGWESNFGIIDDLYICDGNTTLNTSFMGDVKINVIRPNGDNTVQWTGTGSSTATHYLNVNETDPDGDTSYVYSTATGSMELYDWEDISAFTGTIKGVQMLVYARKDEEGARVIQLLEGTTGTNTITNAITSKADIYLNDNYDYHTVALDTSPTTGSAWTVTDFNADRFGYKIGTNT